MQLKNTSNILTLIFVVLCGKQVTPLWPASRQTEGKKSLCQYYLIQTCLCLCCIAISAIHPVWHLAPADWAQLSPARLCSFRGGQWLGAEHRGHRGGCSAYWVAWLGRGAQRGSNPRGPVGRQAWRHSGQQLPATSDQVPNDNSETVLPSTEDESVKSLPPALSLASRTVLHQVEHYENGQMCLWVFYPCVIQSCRGQKNKH